jgi:hypothetical protein
MPEMEVDKYIIFSLAELDNSEQLPPSDFMWCWNDSDNSDLPLCRILLKRLEIYIAYINPQADKWV